MIHTILIADDHPVVLSGLRALIDADPTFNVVATASDGAQAMDRIAQLAPDIAVLDFRMPLQSGLEVLGRIRVQNLRTRVVILAAAASDHDVHAIVTAGARGLLFKESAPQVLLECLDAVARGETWMPDGTDQIVARTAEQRDLWQSRLLSLTNREFEIVRLVNSGSSNKEIAYALQLREGTVKVHLYNIFRKLDVKTRAELVARAQRQPLLARSNA